MELHRTLKKKLAWPINAVLFNLIRLYPFRDKHLWVFSSRGGDIYDDNSKYLFEYIHKHHSDVIRAVWLANKTSIVDTIRKLGYEAYENKSAKGLECQIKAGACFYTHSLNDFGSYPLVGGANIVALWHGVGFKKVYNATYSGLGLAAKKLIDHIYSRTTRSMTIVTSKYTQYQFALQFNLKERDIYICGQPRNDVFKQNVCREQILSDLGIGSDKKMIFYMPTYRMPSLGKDAMNKIVDDLFHSEELNSALHRINGVFVVKPHPMSGVIEIPKRDNFKVLHYKDIVSNQQLLCACDMLISDYSSVSVDYALLKRPIIFYVPDQVAFLSKSEPVYDEFFEISALCKSENPSELAEKIERPSINVVETINERFEAPEIRDTCYSENVYKSVFQSMGLQNKNIV